MREALKCWNQTVQHWLVFVVYKRFPCKKLRTAAVIYVGVKDNVETMESESIHVTGQSLEALLVNTETSVKYKLEVHGLLDNKIRLKINEAYPLKQMFEVPLVLEQVETAPVEEKFRNENSLGLVLKEAKESSVVINLKPFKVDFFKGTNEIRTS